MATSFQGVYPILVTPFQNDESLDLASLARVVRFMRDCGMDGVTVLGVLGEANRMNDHERAAVIRCAVEAAESMPVIVGASHSGTQAALYLTRQAEELGAAAVMITPHAEPVPNEQRIFEYFAHIAAGANLPIVAQDHPASTGVHMSVALLARLVAELPSIACIKEEATPTPPKIAALRDAFARPVPILTGLGALYGAFDLAAGSSGFNTGFAFPEALAAMCRASRAGDRRRAENIYQRVLPLIVFEQQPGVAVRKELFRRRGLIASNRVRHPGAGLAQAAAETLERLIDSIFPSTDLSRPITFD